MRIIAVLILLSLAHGASGEDIRFMSKPAPQPEEGKVLMRQGYVGDPYNG